MESVKILGQLCSVKFDMVHVRMCTFHQTDYSLAMHFCLRCLEEPNCKRSEIIDKLFCMIHDQVLVEFAFLVIVWKRIILVVLVKGQGQQREEEIMKV